MFGGWSLEDRSADGKGVFAALVHLAVDGAGRPGLSTRRALRWGENSVAMWDNRCVQHMAIWDHYPETRRPASNRQGGRPFH